MARSNGQPAVLNMVDSDEECFNTDGYPLKRQTSSTDKSGQDLNCRLVACTVPSPTSADTLDEPRLSFDEFRRKVSALVVEFFCAMDVNGMVESLIGLDCGCFHDELVVIILRASLDRKEAERKVAVKLLNVLADKGHVSTPQLVRGFEKLVLTWTDLRLDVPDAPGQVVALLSDKVGLVDKAFFCRLPEDLLRTLVQELQEGPAKTALQMHLEDLASFKKELAHRLDTDIYRDRSVDAFATWLRSKEMPAFHHEVVLRACLSSFETTPSLDAYWTSCFDKGTLAAEKRRLVFELLMHLRDRDEGSMLEEVDLQIGFSRLLGEMGNVERQSAEDRAGLIALLRGAVEHELLAAEFLKTARRMRFGGSWGVDVIKETQRQTPMFSRRTWGSGDKKQFRAEMETSIQEYFDSNSVDELAQIVEELHLSENEQAQFIRKFLTLAMERDDGRILSIALDAIGALVGQCWSNKEVWQAFEQLRESAPDLALDLPRFQERTNDLVCAATGRGLLEKSYQMEAIV